MKNLLKNIWDAPAATFASGLSASIGVIIVADIEVSPWVIISLSATSAFLALFSGPNKA